MTTTATGTLNPRTYRSLQRHWSASLLASLAQLPLQIIQYRQKNKIKKQLDNIEMATDY
jgi:hypothetical protein